VARGCGGSSIVSSGTEKLLALGVYPDVSLISANEKRDEARPLVADRMHIAAKKRAEGQARADTFAAIASDYIELRHGHLNPRTLAKAE
jgi:hypothetical protein